MFEAQKLRVTPLSGENQRVRTMGFFFLFPVRYAFSGRSLRYAIVGTVNTGCTEYEPRKMTSKNTEN